MAAPGAKQQCFICLDEVTEAQYRRELTCSYAACPGSDHAYHEECITEYLRKNKYPVDRLIGYVCPVVLDNGRPCTGRITATHHKQPLNQKKKQKRVEAAAAAAVAAKAKPVPKLKEAKQEVSGVAIATAAMRPLGEVAVRKASTSSAAKSGIPIVIKSNVQPVSIGMGPAAKLGGAALAVQNNNSMAPERVVRQRIAIPGWTDPKELNKGPSLEQQRAKAAALQAEARNAAGRNSKATGNHPGASGSAGAAAGAQASSAATGEMSRPTITATTPAQMTPSHSFARSISSVDSDTNPFSRYLRAGEDVEDSGTTTEQEFSYAHEEFPAIPPTASDSGLVSQSHRKTNASTAMLNELESSANDDASNMLLGAVSAPPASIQSTHAAAAGASPFDDEEDPVVAHDPVYELDDGTYAVQDPYGNYFRVSDMYGENVEYIGIKDDDINVTYYVIVRKSHVDRQLALMQQQAEAAAADDGADGSGGGSLPSSGTTTPGTLPEPPACQAALREGLADRQGAATAPADPYATAVVSHLPNVPGQSSPSAFTPSQPAAPEDGGGGHELDDLLALCMGGAAPAPASFQEPAKSLHFNSAPIPVLVASEVPFYGCGEMHVFAGADPRAEGLDEEAEDVDSLMQLLCIAR